MEKYGKKRKRATALEVQVKSGKVALPGGYIEAAKRVNANASLYGTVSTGTPLGTATESDVENFLANSPWGVKTHHQVYGRWYAEIELQIDKRTACCLADLFRELMNAREIFRDASGEIVRSKLQDNVCWQSEFATTQITECIKTRQFVASPTLNDRYLHDHPVQLVMPAYSIILDGHHRAISEEMATGAFTAFRIRSEDLLGYFCKVEGFRSSYLEKILNDRIFDAID
jgi:hypothetical protein